MKLLVLCVLFIFLFSQAHSAGTENYLTCAACKVVLTELDNTIVDPANEEEVRDKLLAVCRYIDSQIETICIEFVTEYTDDIIEMLVNGILDPEAICTNLTLCP